MHLVLIKIHRSRECQTEMKIVILLIQIYRIHTVILNLI